MIPLPALAVLLLLPTTAGVLAPDDPGISRRIEGWPRADDPPPEPPSTPTVPPPVAPGPPPAIEAPACPGGSGPEPRPSIESWHGPSLMLSYRQFGFVRVGAVAPGASGAAPQTFHVLSLDLIPISWLLRISLAPELGWASGGDWFASMSGAIGLQWPALITPFAEFSIGGGYFRREQFGIPIPTALVHLGVDGGAAVRIARHFWLGASLGYIRAVNWFVREASGAGVYTNSFTFKLSVGF